MKEIQQANNTSYSNWLWNSGKQALKGVTVMGLGVLGYVGLRGYWNNDSSNSTTKSENADLVLTKEKSGVLFNQSQGNSVTSSLSATSNSLWRPSASEQSISYRHKRGVVPVNQEF